MGGASEGSRESALSEGVRSCDSSAPVGSSGVSRDGVVSGTSSDRAHRSGSGGPADLAAFARDARIACTRSRLSSALGSSSIARHASSIAPSVSRIAARATARL